MTHAMARELVLRKKFVLEPVSTIYFGGGTPSILEDGQIVQLIETINQHFEITPGAEITLEANPDDLSPSRLKTLYSAGVNRLSIGIQSFDEQRLKWMNRAHTALEAQKCLEWARHAGFDNISADLIYALPPANLAQWKQDLQTLINYEIPHISLYGLTIENKTVFGHQHRKGLLQEVSDEVAADQYLMAVQWLGEAGYEHYEVSNFAQPGWHSRHNAAYWEDIPYLGVGPAAHSYDGVNRWANIASNADYLKSLAQDQLAAEMEPRSKTARMNEYLFTRLRTQDGLDLKLFRHKFGQSPMTDHSESIHSFMENGWIHSDSDYLRLTTAGFLLADEITAALFYEEPE